MISYEALKLLAQAVARMYENSSYCPGMERDDADPTGDGGSPASKEPVLTPPMDFRANDENYVWRIDLPGVEKEDIRVTIDEEGVIITALRKEPKILAVKKVRNCEYGTFQHLFAIQKDMDMGNLTAKLSNGVLDVRVPKLAGPTGRNVPVE
ncbi:MAG: Small heat shock protein (Class I) [Parcubacteria group bacterium GW2011_GWB1_56_8]|nr:MAG: Small heat shock protein (Class I) [Parcubacteria group bacterium GW2011_GWB1_56_8]